MKRRREHGECDIVMGGRGCLVLGSPVCKLRKGPSGLKTFLLWVKTKNTPLWWLFAGLVGLGIGLAFGAL